MVMLDSDVLIDCLRSTEPARQWLSAARHLDLLIPGIVAMELVHGARSSTDLRRVHQFLGAFQVVWPDEAEFTAGFESLSRLHLANGIGIPDCLVAAAALQRGATLQTFNRRHFAPVPGLSIAEP